MSTPRLSLLASSVLVVPLALVVGAAGPVAAQQPTSTFGSHVSSCAHTPTSNGFTGAHNPSHHRGPTAIPAMHCMHH